MNLLGTGTFILNLRDAVIKSVMIMTVVVFLSSFAFAEDVQFYHGHKVRAGEFIVKLKNPVDSNLRISSQGTQEFMKRVGEKHKMRLVQSYSGLHMHHMKVDVSAGNQDTDALMSQLKANNAEISYIEPNYIVEKMDVNNNIILANEAAQYYSLSQVLSVIGGGYGITSVPIQAQTAWTLLSAAAATVTVAVIDTGIDFNHPSLSQSIWTNRGEIANNGIDDDRNGYIDDIHGWNFVAKNNSPQDDNGHGTHVSGITVGVGNNIFQTPNTTTTIQIMPLKFLDSNGQGASSDALNAIYYAANNGARVINNSWGGGNYSTAVVEAIAYSYSKDILFVAAAGNSSGNNDKSPNYPASYSIPNIVSVAASDSNDNLAGFSNYGQSTVMLSAPGVSVLSTWPGNAFAYLSGTSMASPFVAGAAALMRYQTPQMNSYQVKTLVAKGVNQSTSLSTYVQSGGRVNVYNSVNLSMNTALDSSQPSFSVSLNPNDREIAGAFANQGAGCGSIAQITDDQLKLRRVVVISALLMLPVFFVYALRDKSINPATRRKYDRYAIDSQMTLKIGDQELVGAVKTISMGGAGIDTNALLSNGSVISMTISSPDGREKIEVQGHVVWSESQKRYGVAFDNVSDAVKAQIGQWQHALTKV